MLMTGEQDKQSLFDGRSTYFDGERIDDLPGHPILGDGAQHGADGYDWMKERAVDGQSPLAAVPTTPEELRAEVDIVHQSGMLSHVTYTSIMTLATTAGRIKDTAPQYIEQIRASIDDAEKRP